MGFIASENKAIHTHPSLLHSKLGCLLFSTSSLNSDTTLLELAKCQKGPLGKSVSINFVTNVAKIIHERIKTFLLLISRHSSLLKARN